MKNAWIKWGVLGLVAVGILVVIYLKYGIGAFLIGVLSFLAGKFLTWARIRAAFLAIDNFMIKVSKGSTPATPAAAGAEKATKEG